MRIVTATLGLSLLLTVPATAQLGGLGLGGIGKAGAGNVTGLLGYCVKNKLTGGATAQTMLGKLTGQPAVKESPDYKQGLLGQVTGSGKAAPYGGATGGILNRGLSLESLPAPLRTKACDMVLSRAGSFL